MTVLMPIPYFSSLALKLPHLKNYFGFLKLAEESRNELAQDYTMIPTKFFTLPVEVLRKRNCYLAAKSCIKALSKSAINFSLIHAHGLENGFIAAALKNLSGKPFVVTVHGGDVYYLPFRDKWYQALARYVLSKADYVITVSQFLHIKLLSLGISSNKLRVIYNGYDEQIFRHTPQQEARKKLGLPLEKKILLSVGNLVNIKGHSFLIDAMSFVLKKRSDVILIIVGSGPLKAKLRKTINRLGLNKKILLAGSKPHEEIPMWMNASDFFVLSSLGEGFPTVIPEAMACGKPIIATRVGGVPEAIFHQDLGILVSPRNSKDLASAILEALDKKWKPEIILHHAKRYSWNNLVEQILDVYREVL
jgi:glycosyltransferase involved in cell wall biosynthesis